MTCEYCDRDVFMTILTVEVDGNVAMLCPDCRRDVEYCRAGGQIPQNPEDA